MSIPCGVYASYPHDSWPVYGLVLASAAVLVAALFFAGPALASCQSGGLMASLANSLGRAPACCARLLMVWFLVSWIGVRIAIDSLAVAVHSA